MNGFHVASGDAIKSGKTTDIYFLRTKRVMEAKGLKGVRVTAEVTASSLPDGAEIGIFCGDPSLLKGAPTVVVRRIGQDR